MSFSMKKLLLFFVLLSNSSQIFTAEGDDSWRKGFYRSPRSFDISRSSIAKNYPHGKRQHSSTDEDYPPAKRVQQLPETSSVSLHKILQKNAREEQKFWEKRDELREKYTKQKEENIRQWNKAPSALPFNELYTEREWWQRYQKEEPSANSLRRKITKLQGELWGLQSDKHFHDCLRSMFFKKWAEDNPKRASDLKDIFPWVKPHLLVPFEEFSSYMSMDIHAAPIERLKNKIEKNIQTKQNEISETIKELEKETTPLTDDEIRESAEYKQLAEEHNHRIKSFEALFKAVQNDD
jgi:hypothetical protein